MPIKNIKWGIASLAAGAILMSIACSSGSSPASPSTVSTSTSTSTTTPTTTGAATGSVAVTVNPSPVPFSGVPITDSPSCAGAPNTWFYTQNLVESGGVQVTFTSRIDSFDSRVVNSLTGLSIVIPANGSALISTRWCSSSNVSHTAQSSFTGTDANGHAITVAGPVVNLRSQF